MRKRDKLAKLYPIDINNLHERLELSNYLVLSYFLVLITFKNLGKFL